MVIVDYYLCNNKKVSVERMFPRTMKMENMHIRWLWPLSVDFKWPFLHMDCGMCNTRRLPPCFRQIYDTMCFAFIVPSHVLLAVISDNYKLFSIRMCLVVIQPLSVVRPFDFFSIFSNYYWHFLHLHFFFSSLLSACVAVVHPLIQVPNMLVGSPLGVDIMLVCNAEASPKAINYWQRENGE